MLFFFPVDDIKNKFKNLRTTFQRHSKMVQASKGSEDVVLPQWKHYQQLMFLQGCPDQDDLPLSPPHVPEKGPQSVVSSQGTNTCFVPSLPTSSSSSCLPSHTMIKCVWTDERERVLITFFSGKQLHYIVSANINKASYILWILMLTMLDSL